MAERPWGFESPLSHLLSTHAFGWSSKTPDEILADHALVKELRLQRTASLIDLVRVEARGS